MTQEQLAEAIDSTKQTVSRMESGQSPYNQPFLEACADALDCLPSQLLHCAPDQRSEVEELVDLLKGRSPSDIQKVVAFVKILDS